MVALSIYYYGLKKTPAWVSAICELTWPLSAVLIDYVVYHKSLSMTQWIGSGLFACQYLYDHSRLKKYGTSRISRLIEKELGRYYLRIINESYTHMIVVPMTPQKSGIHSGIPHI